MDTAQWLQESGDQVDENKVAMEDHHHHHDQMMGSNNNGNASCPSRSVLEKRARPQEQLNCPRCNSTNTKFCYYNNYSLTQPRYFCKTCRRYWTEGGTLRNVPVGGGSRKNKKPTSSSSASTNNIINIPDLNPPTSTLSHFSSSHHHHHQNPRAPPHEAQDLNLAFNALEHANYHSTPNPMDLLRSTAGIASRGVNNNNSFIPTQMPPPDHHSNAIYSSSSSAGFSSLQEYKPTSLGFCVDGLGNRYGDDDHENSNVNGGGRILFPFGDLKQIPSSTNHHHELDHQSKGPANNPTGYWNGLLGGGSW